MKTLPIEFKNFKHLEQISLRGNYDLDLSQTFQTLSHIKSLKTLDLSFTRIKTIPKELGRLTNIENLYLGNWEWCCPLIDFFGKAPYNYIHELPKSVTNLTNLKNLYLWTWEISDKKKEKMKSLLPNVNIEFDSKRPEQVIELEIIEEKKK